MSTTEPESTTTKPAAPIETETLPNSTNEDVKQPVGSDTVEQRSTMAPALTSSRPATVINDTSPSVIDKPIEREPSITPSQSVSVAGEHSTPVDNTYPTYRGDQSTVKGPGTAISTSRNVTPSQSQTVPASGPISESEAFNLLSLASRILAHFGILDAWGHVSMRHPTSPETHFLLGRNLPPALMTPSDIIVYRISDAEPVAQNGPRGFIERYIHSELYKKFPVKEVDAVVHCHTSELIPFGLAAGRLPFKAAAHVVSFSLFTKKNFQANRYEIAGRFPGSYGRSCL